jgi:hypothetical protein
MLADVLHRLGTTAKRLGDLPIRPRRTIGIGLEQNLRPPDFLTRSAQLLYHATKFFPLLIRQTNHVFLPHQSLLALEPTLSDYPNSLM